MKILVTGTSAKQIGSERAFQVMLNSGTVVEALRAAGHEVDWRAVVPGEDLSGYGKVVVYLGPVNALGSQYTFGALWALASRPDAMYALDDWQVKQLTYGARSLLKLSPKAGLFKPALNRRHREEAEPLAEKLMVAMEELVGHGSHTRTCLTPMFKKGKPESLGFVLVKKHVVFDPTALWLERYSKVVAEARAAGKVTEKVRTWTHASLLSKNDWVEKQGLSWPVVAYGNIKEKQERIPEVELLPLIAGSWGLLSAPHSNPSSGWFRVRFPIAAACGNVMFGDFRELATVYGTEGFLLTRYVRSIEQASDEQLAEVAALQRERLEQQMMPWDTLVNVVSEGVTHG